jgi:hypothetical protein
MGTVIAGTHHLGIFKGAPIILRCGVCDKWRRERSPEVRSSGRDERWIMRAAPRDKCILYKQDPQLK